MFGIGGFNPVSLLATAALGPAGGIVAQLATQIISQMGQQIIQSMGNQLGLPQSTIDMAQGAFAGANGDFAGQFRNADEALQAFGAEYGASPAEIGNAQRVSNDFIRDIVDQMSQSEDFKEAKANPKGKAGVPGAPGWLMAMATVLGEKLDELAADMEQRAATISEKDPSSSAEFGVVSQQFSMLMNATNNAIKTIGEALAGMARKQ
ncbi:hypothetical protein COC42_01890 [Sphingomonas spermidinifaciens]|uniref:Uncharacterized protein n=1 Tax=Sphingomonas spermidinifaciens TaxID=1141889 RepID=A0A2A4B607_9SPHN|nr:hypothetical protein [Sphingomonas spermidinifaciens]PCD03198.1 hypothetical protein COC42_01890 [Sphingomonas spermidinifaciens]